MGEAHMKQIVRMAAMAEEQGTTVDKIKPTGPAPQSVSV